MRPGANRKNGASGEIKATKESFHSFGGPYQAPGLGNFAHCPLISGSAPRWLKCGSDIVILVIKECLNNRQYNIQYSVHFICTINRLRQC